MSTFDYKNFEKAIDVCIFVNKMNEKVAKDEMNFFKVQDIIFNTDNNEYTLFYYKEE